MGVGGGFFVLVLPTLGFVLIAAGVIGVVRARRPLPGGAGLFIGVGATMVLLLISAQRRCEAFDAAPNQGCVARRTWRHG